ncbi:MAG: hypothetical protein JO206_07620 [Solirubrobacterales bacterium]|nr:hypothetical protein [Solirubrobacterales bacterium]MBV9472821.1 hypothetical protein [Solirubrobacterales bacterium]
MTQQLEAELRELLARRAADVPAHASDRLSRIDYRPRTGRIKKPVALGAFAGSGGAAAAVVALVGLGAGASSAFAGWTPTPTVGSAAQTLAAEAACKARLEHSVIPFDGASTQAVLTDTRGPFTFVIFAGHDSNNSCISGPSFTSISGSARSDASSAPVGKVVLTSLHYTIRDGSAYTLIEGHTGSGVSSTTLVRADGTRVKASSANGWFSAWWPGSMEPAAAELTTPQGTSTQRILTHGRVLCGSGPCTSEVSASSGRVSGMRGASATVSGSSETSSP